MTNIKRCIILLGLLNLLGCSMNQQATSKYHSSYDFSKIESYSTFDRNSAFDEFQTMSDATRNSIEIAIEKSLDAKGYLYKNSKDADVIIGYHLINSSTDLKKYNKGVRFCGPCLHSRFDESNSKDWKMLPGSLILDVVNQKDNRSIWRSVLPLKIKVKDNSREAQAKIQHAIDNMIKTLPRYFS